jgi:hypothetical protein
MVQYGNVQFYYMYLAVLSVLIRVQPGGQLVRYPWYDSTQYSSTACKFSKIKNLATCDLKTSRGVQVPAGTRKKTAALGNFTSKYTAVIFIFRTRK